MSDRAQVNVRDIPRTVIAAVRRDAKKRNLSVNNVVGEILAQRFGQTWDSSGYGFTDSGEADQWVLRLPIELRDAIKAEARDGATMTGVILVAVSEHYKLKVSPPTKRGGKTLDPKIVQAAALRHYQKGESIRSLAREYGIKRETLTKAIRA
jgi:hypothetical protein